MEKRLAILLAAGVFSSAQAVDYQGVYDSVNKEKAAESVDTQKMGEAVGTEGVDYKKAYDAVDKEKAADSVDTEKAREALMK